MTLKENYETNLHYMKVLQQYYHHMQPEIREAIDFSVVTLETLGKLFENDIINNEGDINEKR